MMIRQTIFSLGSLARKPPCGDPVFAFLRQVTVLFADVKGSMDLAEQLDPDQWRVGEDLEEAIEDRVEVARDSDGGRQP